MSYGSAMILGVIGTALTPILPTLHGTTAATFAVSPDLPSGLELDPVSGILSGTPVSISPSIRYQVTASNGFGSTACAIQVEVVAPSAPVFTESVSLALVAGTPTLAYRFQVTSLPAVQAFSVSPPLPQGLALDPVSGTLSGTPASPSPLSVYTVSATNAVSTTFLPLALSVNPSGWPMVNAFTARPAALHLGQDLTLSWYVPNAQQVNINGVTIDPAIYDSYILVTPPLGTTSYTLVATNAQGSATAQVLVNVVP
jgi:hypothetical protein